MTKSVILTPAHIDRLKGGAPPDREVLGLSFANFGSHSESGNARPITVIRERRYTPIFPRRLAVVFDSISTICSGFNVFSSTFNCVASRHNK